LDEDVEIRWRIVFVSKGDKGGANETSSKKTKDYREGLCKEKKVCFETRTEKPFPSITGPRRAPGPLLNLLIILRTHICAETLRSGLLEEAGRLKREGKGGGQKVKALARPKGTP